MELDRELVVFTPGARDGSLQSQNYPAVLCRFLVAKVPGFNLLEGEGCIPHSLEVRLMTNMFLDEHGTAGGQLSPGFVQAEYPEVRELAPSNPLEFLQELAYELHDGPVQVLTAAVMDLEVAIAASNCPEQCQQKAHTALGKIRSALKELRQLISELESGHVARASPEDWTGAVLRVAEFAETAGVRCDVMFHQVAGYLPPAVAWRSLRIIQEAVNNILRHSGASRAQISVSRVGDWLFFCVRDWGKGFYPTDVGQEGTGLRSMKYRTRNLGGWLLVEGAPGKGTRVLGAIPLNWKS